MNKIYNDAKDKNVVATYVYVKTGKAYADEACETQLKTSELQELFIKGAVIVDTNVMYKPVNFKVASDIGTIAYIKPNATTATQADIATAVSVAG